MTGRQKKDERREEFRDNSNITLNSYSVNEILAVRTFDVAHS